jgi:hypothetical protein
MEHKCRTVTPREPGFPEMLDVLRVRWRTDLTFSEMIILRDELDAMLHRIRSERHIRTPVIKCRRCGHVGPAAEPDVTVRAMIFSLGRFGIVPADVMKALDKRWAAYRKQHGLDLYGKPADNAGEAAACGHQ